MKRHRPGQGEGRKKKREKGKKEEKRALWHRTSITGIVSVGISSAFSRILAGGVATGRKRRGKKEKNKRKREGELNGRER